MSSQAGLIAQLKFMESIGIDDLLNSIESKVSLKSTYSLADILKMVTLGITAGASSLLQVCSTWNDKVLTDIARFESIPDDSTVNRRIYAYCSANS